MPWSSSEAVTNEECANSNGDGECDEGSDGADREDSANGNLTGEDEEDATAADEDIEPDSVDRGLCGFVDARPVAGEWEASITGVGKGYTGCGNHTALAHRERSDDGQAEAGKGCVLAEALEEESGPWLAKV